MLSDLWLSVGVHNLREEDCCMKHCTVPVLLYSGEIMGRREKERSRIKVGQMDNLRVCWVLVERIE